MVSQRPDREAVHAALLQQVLLRACNEVVRFEDDTDINGELRINGEDLAEIFGWMHSMYGVDCSSVSNKHYDINEPPGRWWNPVPYAKVTVKEVLDAVERGYWISPT